MNGLNTLITTEMDVPDVVDLIQATVLIWSVTIVVPIVVDGHVIV